MINIYMFSKFETKIFDVNGRINGPALPFLKEWEKDLIIKQTSFLNINPKIALKHRILALKLKISTHPFCKNNCGSLTCLNPSKDKLFGIFCSDRCASQWAKYDINSRQKLKDSVPARLDVMKKAAAKGRKNQKDLYGGFGFQRNEIQNKIQDERHLHTNGYNWKVWNGYKVQGYEHLFLNEHYKTNIVIEKSKIPKFKNPTYWPDLFDEDTQMLYEVKSIFTLVHGLLFDNLIQKLSSAVKSYDLELHLYFYKNKEPKSLVLFLKKHTMIGDIVSSLKNFLTNIYQSNPCVLHRLGKKYYQHLMEWLGVQTD